MHLHAKLIAGLLILLLGIAVSIALSLHLYLLPHVQIIEERRLHTDLDRINQGLAQELQRLSSLAADWGQWDDTYSYMHSRDPAYVRSNLPPNLLPTINADLFALITENGQLLQFMSRDSGRLGPTQHNEQDMFGPHIRQLQHTEHAQGLFLTARGPILLASSPIVQSDGHGKHRGTLVFGKKIDGEFQRFLAELTQLKVVLETSQQLFPQPKISFPSDDDAKAQQTHAFVNTPSAGLLISVTKARPYFQEAKSVIGYTMLIIAGVGIVVSLLAYLFLKSTIIKPILMLKAQADSFGHKRSLAGFNPISQNDELGALSLSFMKMARQLVKSQGELELERQRYMDASLTDPLTKLRNRRFMDQYFAESRATQLPEPVLILMVDLDHFKQVNDSYGHDAGDIVLRELAELLQNISRNTDLVVRYGGEEFMLVCRNTHDDTACAIAERIRTEVETFTFFREKAPTTLTCSVGFFTCLASTAASADDWYAMTKVADLALYAAKNSGRNTWVGLKADTCKQAGKLPAETEEVRASLRNRRLTSYCHCGDSRQIHWA